MLLVDQNGLQQAVYQVVGIERVPSLGVHGFLPLYAPGGQVGAYKVYGGEATGALPAGGATSGIQPSALALNPGSLFQARMLIRVAGTLPTGVTVDDFDLTLNSPAAIAHWQLQNQGGSLNAARQFAFPADANLMPTQGADMSLPAAYPALVDPLDAAYQSEFFIWGQSPASFILTNQSATAIPASTAVMVGVNIGGIRYDLDTWPASLVSQSTRLFSIGGKSVTAPPDAVVVPVAASAPPSRTSSL